MIQKKVDGGEAAAHESKHSQSLNMSARPSLVRGSGENLFQDVSFGDIKRLGAGDPKVRTKDMAKMNASKRYIDKLSVREKETILSMA